MGDPDVDQDFDFFPYHLMRDEVIEVEAATRSLFSRRNLGLGQVVFFVGAFVDEGPAEDVPADEPFEVRVVAVVHEKRALVFLRAHEFHSFSKGCRGFDTRAMTSPTTHQQALEVFHVLTAEHSNEPYFKKAEIVLTDGFYGVDIWVDRELWQRQKRTIQVNVNRVPVCYIMQG
jgi:hypothetical protein